MYRLSARISCEAASRRSWLETAGEAAAVRVCEPLEQPANVGCAAVLFAGRSSTPARRRNRTGSSTEGRSENQTPRFTRRFGTVSGAVGIAAADPGTYAYPEANLRLCRDARDNRRRCQRLSQRSHGPDGVEFPAGGRSHQCAGPARRNRSEEHTSELQSHSDLVCRLLLE